MSEDIRNNKVELTDEEAEKVAGGVKPHSMGTAFCVQCQVYYSYDNDGSGKIPKHNCPPSYPYNMHKGME